MENTYNKYKDVAQCSLGSSQTAGSYRPQKLGNIFKMEIYSRGTTAGVREIHEFFIYKYGLRPLRWRGTSLIIFGALDIVIAIPFWECFPFDQIMDAV